MSKKPKRPQSFLKTPGYPGGRKALTEFLRNNLKYPQQAVQSRIEGKVTLKLEIDQKGKVNNVIVKHGIGYGCDEEAIRLAKLLKFEKVKNRKVRATYHKSLTIPFVLGKKSIKEKSTNIVYTYKGTEKQSGQTYSYKIKL